VRALETGPSILAVLVTSALLLAACGGDAGPGATPTSTTIPTSSPRATLAPPQPTSTPYPTVTPASPSGRIVARMQAGCEVGEHGLVVRVRYGSGVEGTEDAEAVITRVRVYMDGVLGADSGPIADRIYAREAAFKGLARRLHTVQLSIDTRAAPKPSDFVQFARCPAEPDTPLARVVS
jgi:hypothetical protein